MTEIADLPERQLTSTPLVELTLHDNNPRTHSKKQIARIADSITRFAQNSGIDRFLLDLRTGVHDDLRNELMEQRLKRFIGVIYRSETEGWSHYSFASLPAKFDAFVWFDKTSAVTPLPAPEATDHQGTQETYPFGS